MATIRRVNADRADPSERFAPTIKGGTSEPDQQDKKPGSFDPLYIVIPGALIGIAIAIYFYANS